MMEPAANWKDCLEYAAVTDIGQRRANNQDSHAVVLASGDEDWSQRGHLFVVADGMGAHAAGELASKLAVDQIPHHYKKYTDLSPPEALKKSILATNAEIHRRGQENLDFRNMGTTASTLLLLPQGAMVGHAGDSRVYLMRGDELHQITFDHSLVWEMRASGQLSDSAEFVNAIPKNVITRSLGPNPTVDVDVEGPYPLEVGDTFLLCSDGLTGRVSDEEIGTILANLPPKEAAEFLVDLANLRGGPDNITVVIARVVGDRMTTRVAQSEPLRIGVKKKVAVPLAFWAVAAVLLLVALAMAVLQFAIPAVVAAAGGVLTLVLATWRMMAPQRAGTTIGQGLKLGKGPYVHVTCPPGTQFLERLTKIIRELREAAEQKNWDVDWGYVESTMGRGTDAAGRGDRRSAIRTYCEVIRYLVSRFRRTDSDSVL